MSSLSFSRSSEAKTFETKSGSYIYAGEARTFHEWEFRTFLKARSTAAGAPLPRTEEHGEPNAEEDAEEDAEEHACTARSRPRRINPANARHMARDAQKVVEGLR